MITDTLKRIEIVVGDITQLNVNAIVNAANTSLSGGGQCIPQTQRQTL